MATLGCGGQIRRGHCYETNRRPIRVSLTDDSTNFISSPTSLTPCRQSGARASVINSYSSTPQAVHIRAGVHVHAAQVGLLRAHVRGRADEHFESGEKCSIGQPLVGCRFCYSKIDYYRQSKAVFIGGYQDVGRLDVPVNDSLLVSVLNRPTNRKGTKDVRRPRVALWSQVIYYRSNP